MSNNYKPVPYDYELTFRALEVDAAVLRHVKQQVEAGTRAISLDGFLQLHLDAIQFQLGISRPYDGNEVR